MTTSQSETDSTVEITKPRFQFQLSHIFFVTTLFVMAMSADPWLLIPAVTWILLCCYAKIPEQPVKRLSRLAISVPFACCFLGPVVVFTSSPPYHNVKRTVCTNNMRQLQYAMLNYELAYREFPEATELDNAGKPMHSWRVKILPFIEQQALYNQYDFSQPWDSPTNIKLLDQMPDCFRCPHCQKNNRTFYKLVVGPGTLFDGGERTINRISDGTSNTIAIIEDGQNPVEWTRPSDISIDDAIAALAPEDFKKLPHVDDATLGTTYDPGSVVFFDGHTLPGGYLSGSRPTLLRNMLQIDDGNIVNEYELAYRGAHTAPKYGPIVAQFLFMLMMVYPLVWVFRDDRHVVEQN